MKSVIENQDGTYTIDGRIYSLQITEQPYSAETKESVFAELCKNLERKEDRAKYPNSVFWLDEYGHFMFEHDEKNDYFWCSDARVWSVFESKFGMKYIDIQSFTKGMVEKHFKCNGVTPFNRFKSNFFKVEEHFKCNGVTTTNGVFD